MPYLTPRRSSRMPAALLAASLTLTACGGGGGGGGGDGTDSADGGGDAGGGALIPRAPAGVVGQAGEPCSTDDLSRAALAVVNAVRAQGRQCIDSDGVTRYHEAVVALTWDNRLAQAAAMQATDMATHGYVGHVSSTGSNAVTRIESTGYRWRSYAENLTGGPATLNGAVQDWVSSKKGHCENLMRTSVTQMGMACSRNPSSQYGTYWALVMGRPAN